MFSTKNLLRIAGVGIAFGVGTASLYTGNYLGGKMGNTTAGRKFNDYLFNNNNKQKKEKNLRNPQEKEACYKLGLLTPDEAQHTNVYKISNFLTYDEIEKIKQAIRKWQNERKIGIVERNNKEQRSTFKDAVWRTSFLHTNNQFKKFFPEIHARIIDQIIITDKKHWKLIHHRQNKNENENNNDNTLKNRVEHLNLRTIESHEYTNGGQLQRNKHYDAGSIVTIDIMLNDSNNEFQGGELSFPQFFDQELDEPNTSRTNNVDIIKLEKGDMALFLSHKYHNVLPIRSGKRHVLVMELWNGPEKTCPHRCETVGKCTHTLNRSHLGNFSQHVGLLG